MHNTLILHNYYMSPFSEKIRAMLAYSQLEWISAPTSDTPPRPVIEALAGGYRKIPVAQIGADIFCDSRTIASEIAARTNLPLLALENCDEAVQDYAKHVDLKIFFACLFSSGSLALGRKVLKSMSFGDLGRFIIDRANIGRTASSSVPKMGLFEAKRVIRQHLEDLESRLTGNYIFGEQANHADFSAYHSLWFARDLAESGLFKNFPKINAWMDRLQAADSGCLKEIDPKDCLAIAQNAKPRAIPEAFLHDEQIGQTVSIAPADYGRLPTTGVLVGSNGHQWIIARESSQLGLVHVHFPKLGYSLRTL